MNRTRKTNNISSIVVDHGLLYKKLTIKHDSIKEIGSKTILLKGQVVD